jgi:tetratricopeptide (TPR) repeat protein
MAATSPDDAGEAHNVELAHGKLGDALFANHANAEAIAEYRAAIEVAELNLRTHPTTSWKDELADSHSHLAEVLVETGDRTQAIAEYRAALDLAVEVLATDPTNADWKTRVAELKKKLAR